MSWSKTKKKQKLNVDANIEPDYAKLAPPL